MSIMFGIDQSLLVQLCLIVLILGVVWFALRFVLRLTARIFSIGCGVIIFIGICYKAGGR